VAARTRARAPAWWPLLALTALAAALRLSTLGLQSFWFDEAFTPIHVLHTSLITTLKAVVHTENTPPLWYAIEWLDWRVLGSGEVALRLPSALAGIATVPVAWAIGAELGTRRTAIACAALVAVNPLFVWYSQEARAYGLFVLASALALLFFLRAERDPTPRRMAAFALAGALALLTHYFAVFLLIGMVLWLAREPALRRASLGAVAALVAVGLALLPLIAAQGGHGTQWIGRWPLGERIVAIPQYFLLGTSGEPLGHGVELLVALPLIGCVLLGLWRLADAPSASAAGSAAPAAAEQAARSAHRTPERSAAMLALIAGCGVLIPLLLVVFGADYLAPRNLVGAMIPVTALIAVLGTVRRDDVLATTLVALSVVALAAITLDVDLSPRLQRGDWRGVAHALARSQAPRTLAYARGGGRYVGRAITTVELGAAPLEYYLPGLHNLAPGSTVLVSEIDETGYAPLRASAGEPPAPGFRLRERLDIHGLIVFRFVSAAPREVREATLRRHVITLAHPEVLVPARA
jgi:4-amino-4-deoxy-L-arabinose transferase-like glycosyltransferase